MVHFLAYLGVDDALDLDSIAVLLDLPCFLAMRCECSMAARPQILSEHCCLLALGESAAFLLVECSVNQN
jgi:hypothetical protein